MKDSPKKYTALKKLTVTKIFVISISSRFNKYIPYFPLDNELKNKKNHGRVIIPVNN